MASFIPNIKTALPKIKKLNSITYSPIEKVDRLLSKMAMTSVPSKQPPNRIIKPTPIPNIAPPRNITKIGLFVKAGKGFNIYIPMDRTKMANKLNTRNLFPRYVYPMIKKGVFNNKRSNPTSTSVT